MAPKSLKEIRRLLAPFDVIPLFDTEKEGDEWLAKQDVNKRARLSYLMGYNFACTIAQRLLDEHISSKKAKPDPH